MAVAKLDELYALAKDIEVNWVTLSMSGLAIFVVSRLVKLLNGIKLTNNMPGFRVPFDSLSLPGVLFNPPLGPGVDMHWRLRHWMYQKYNSDIISFVPYLSGAPSFYTNNMEVAKQVAVGGHKTSFYKPENASRSLLLWGRNIVAADRDLWRKHRRIVGPAFNNTLYNNVFTKTANFYRQMIISEEWKEQDGVVEVPVIQKLTFKLALLVIGACGFGFDFSWAEPPRPEDGSMTLQESMRIVADSNLLAIVAPNWLYKLPIRRLRESKLAHDTMMNFMREQVAERKMKISGQEAKDLDNAFSMLVKASEDENGKFVLDDDELIGNVFILIFAGHETTAHTFAATLGFLSINPEVQEEVYEQIKSVVGNRDPVIEDVPKLDKVLAVFLEALRLFPAGHLMIREAYEDTVLTITNPVGEEGTRTIPVPKGMRIYCDMVGVQYNPRYFEEPDRFKPSRWYGMQNESEEFFAFSVGARACLGRKFATIEAISFLTLFLRDWKAHPKLKDGETPEAWRERVLDGQIVLTLGVTDVPVTFERRK